MPKDKVRKYRGEMPPSVTLEVGKSIEGTFQGMKVVTITDQNTEEEKDVRVYTFRDSKGKKFAMLGRAGLDATFDDLFQKEGGPEKCAGLNMRIERVQDTKLSRNRSMGNYDVAVWEE